MFELFTERARLVVVLANEEARALGFGHVGSEALLLGLLREQHGMAARVLESLGVGLEEARVAVTGYVSAGDEPFEGQMRLTPRATQVLVQAAEESATLGHTGVEPGHILLALASIDEGVGMDVLRDFDLDAASLRAAVIRRLSDRTPPERSGPELPRPRWRRAPGAEAGPSTDPFLGFEVRPDDEVTAVLLEAAARTLEDGRTDMSLGDLLTALSHRPRL